MTDERSSRSILRKKISEPQTGIECAPSDDRWDAPTIELPRHMNYRRGGQISDEICPGGTYWGSYFPLVRKGQSSIVLL